MIWILMCVALLFGKASAWGRPLAPPPPTITSISIKDLYENLATKRAKRIQFTPSMDKVLMEDQEDNLFTADISPFLMSSIVELSIQNDINPILTPTPTPSLLETGIRSFTIPALFLGWLLFQNRGMIAGATQMTSMTRRAFEIPNVTFSDWSGSPEVFEECTEVVSYLRNNTNYLQVGAEIPKGILLEGRPGTGKTLLAKAIANEAEANFMSVSGSEFVELFVGLGASRVRKLFEDARENQPSIIFIDEIDAIGRQRSGGGGLAGAGGGNDEREQTLNQLLTEMDGFRSNENVIVIAATNRRDVLDEALLRPGRFDRIINVPLPDYTSRTTIIQQYLDQKTVDGNRTEMAVALSRATAGFSGASLKNIVNEAAILAARRGEQVVRGEYLMDALEKIMVGVPKRTDTRSADTIERVAIHELGHTLMAVTFPNYFTMKKVTIQHTYSGVGGYTIYEEPEETLMDGFYTKDLLRKRLIVMMGGKAAEAHYYGEEFVSVGASNDLQRANELAREMIRTFGMGDRFRTYADAAEPRLMSEFTLAGIDEEVMVLVDDAYQDACRIVATHKEWFARMLPTLLRNKTMTENFLV